MPPPLAFLSYTRKDDEFFGGYITQFRKMLENGVHVVTGDRSFQIFQDIEGIIIGENWRKKLSEVIHDASFFVPMLSPLFFNSKPCRDEAGQFIEHERILKRGDLILPIYFLTTAKLEKVEEKSKDPLATELASRQMFDWRQQANVPLKDSATREAILALARAIEGALKRLAAEASVSNDEYQREAVAADPSLTEGIAAEVRREELKGHIVLWVDDNPNNNLWERRALESYGVRFVLARDTDEAERKLQEHGPFAAIISDMGRAGDPHAGYTLLARVRKARIQVPYFIYTASRIAELKPDLRTAQGLTSDPDALVGMVLAAIR